MRIIREDRSSPDNPAAAAGLPAIMSKLREVASLKPIVPHPSRRRSDATSDKTNLIHCRLRASTKRAPLEKNAVDQGNPSANSGS